MVVIAAGAGIRRLWLKALLGSSDLPGEKLLGDAIPRVTLPFGVTLLGPLLGAPAAVWAVEQFLTKGSREIVMIGTAGGLCGTNQEPAIGDIVFPRQVFSEDGTTPLYGGPRERNELLLSNLQRSLEQRVASESSVPRCIEGGIWTTDAPVQENSGKVAAYLARGAVAVEMEFSALFTLAEMYKAELAAAFVVSDLLGSRQEKGFRAISVGRSLELLVHAAKPLVAGANRQIS